ncbi:hypothetical protein [Solitalea lacus]|uniref:hypothetical protein n=1 Tax=Solitalea lacus TaxID=2911172 RepID=UPI001EDA3957|nr:hypothetical protein [Solitalea lacus]UKJ08594.1 hypothetical protein L2B55_05365 [Solitalea lacus]
MNYQHPSFRYLTILYSALLILGCDNAKTTVKSQNSALVTDTVKITPSVYKKAEIDSNHLNNTEFDLAKLTSQDLNMVSFLQEGEKLEHYKDGKPLKQYLELEVIDQSLFEAKKVSSVDFLLADTLALTKNDGVIELICKKNTVQYVDKPDAEEDRQVYNYVGQIEFLNKYVISGSYWEDSDYKLIDKTSGESETFGDYPFISADKKSIVCIKPNPYETTGDLELYSINNGKMKFIMGASFTNWMPATEEDVAFWSTDGYFYFVAFHSKEFWHQDGKLNAQYQYLRLKVL